MSYKLIIFDLDDTLIETSKCFLPLELRNTLQAMVNAGLKLENFEQAYVRLMELNCQSLSGQEALKKLLLDIKGEMKYLDVAVKSYYSCASLNFKMETLPGALEVLNSLKDKFILTLVSRGIEEVQMLKLKKAGISLDLFSKIIITDKYDKEVCYKEILEEFKVNGNEVIVIGDKVKGDLLPGKNLGMTTVFMDHGIRAKHFPPQKGEVDFIVSNLNEFTPIVNNFEKVGED